MKSDGATRNYARGGEKFRWRRAVANELLRRTKGRETSECVLYLPGPGDVDREVLRQKGVPQRNLVAVDRSRGNVEAVRRAGGLAVHGDLNEVLWNWPTHLPVCGVLADFVSGFEPRPVASLYTAMIAHPAFNGVTLMVNLQRGRDSHSSHVREALRSLELISADEKHRGRQIVAFMQAMIVAGALVKVGREGLSDDPGRREIERALLADAFVKKDVSQFEDLHRVRYFEYQSQSGIMFDSVLLTCKWTVRERAPVDRDLREKVDSLPMRRQLAAVSAVRTRQWLR